MSEQNEGPQEGLSEAQLGVQCAQSCMEEMLRALRNAQFPVRAGVPDEREGDWQKQAENSRQSVQSMGLILLMTEAMEILPPPVMVLVMRSIMRRFSERVARDETKATGKDQEGAPSADHAG